MVIDACTEMTENRRKSERNGLTAGDGRESECRPHSDPEKQNALFFQVK